MTALRIAALLALASAAPATPAGDELGRLFVTPEQRAQLDRQRALSGLASGTAEDDLRLRIDGLVRRSSGRHTAWINGRAHGDTPATIAVRPDPAHPARLLVDTGDAPPTPLRVGDTLHHDTRETRSALGDGRIVVHRPRAGNAR